MPKYKFIRKKTRNSVSFIVNNPNNPVVLSSSRVVLKKIVPLDGALIDLARPPEHTRQYGALSSNPLLKTIFHQDSVVPRSYRFPSQQGKYVKVEELMLESPLSFHIPILYLKMCINEVNDQITAIHSLGKLTGNWAILQEQKMTELKEILDRYKKRLLFLEQRFGSPYFKRSVDRCVENLDFVPINLHLQRMRVKNESVEAVELVADCKTSFGSTSSTSQSRSWYHYDNISVGATAEHVLGFKHGGLLALLTNAGDRSKKKTNLPNGLRDICLSRDTQTTEEELTCRIDQLMEQIKYQLEKLKFLMKPRSSSSGIYPDVTSSSADALASLSQKVCELAICCESSSIARPVAALVRARPSYQPPKTFHIRNFDATGGKSRKEAVLNGTCASDEHGTSPEVLWEEQTLQVKSKLSDLVRSIHAYVNLDQSSDRSDSVLNQADIDITTLSNMIEKLHLDAKTALVFSSYLLSKHELDLNLAFRRKAVFSQALTICICGVATLIASSLHDELKLKQFAEAGIFLQVESLVSTYGNEQSMLQDYAVGVLDLEVVSFKCVRSTDHQPRNLTPSRKNDNKNQFLPTFEKCNKKLVVMLPFDDMSFELLPQELQEGKLIKVHPVLFNIGINEEQTIAERFGSTSLQDFLNAEALQRTMKYYDLVRDLCPESVGESLADAHSLVTSRKKTSNADASFNHRRDTTAAERSHGRLTDGSAPHPDGNLSSGSESLVGLLKRLDAVLHMKKNKNVEVLELASDICRRMNGIRVTSCKSAKDRTAMSITLEQARILTAKHEMSPSVFIEALNCMRSEGTRRENTLKNTGCRRYAFTSMQLMTFPKLYRPPDGSYGKGES